MLIRFNDFTLCDSARDGSMKLADDLLFAIARRMYTRNMGQSEEMSDALADSDSYADYRRQCVRRVLDAAERYQVPYRNQVVLDLGCYDGAISGGYLEAGARQVIGVDIDEPAVRQAQQNHTKENLEFRVGSTTELPVQDASVDTIFCYDVFEHVACPAPILEQCYRVLRPGGRMLIGTWGWYHPFAPHLWSTMPVPWAHVVFGEASMLRVCRRIYQSDFYRPNMHDFDEDGERLADKFNYLSIPTDYLNKYLIRDFERVFDESSLDFRVHAERFSSKWAAWTAPLLKVPLLREFFTAYIWVVLERPSTGQDMTQPNAQRRSADPAPVATVGAS